MDRIIIDISKGELDFIREAIEVKHINLMSYLDTCEENANPKPSWDEVAKIAEDEFEKELQEIMHDKAVAKNKKTFVYRPKKAPYGVKKDGTPKAKPGRKV